MSNSNQRTKPNERSPTESATSETTVDDRFTCPECGSRGIASEEHGESICENCGMVIEDELLDHGPEWRAFDATERQSKSRVGAPTTKRLHDDGLSTVIDWQNKDAYGRTLTPRQRERMQRLRTWDERFRTRDAKERNLKQALSEIERMASALGIPEAVRETASVIYRRALEEDLLPGRSIEGVATAALYAATRQVGTPRSLDEVAAVSRVDRLEFARTYRYLGRELDLKIEPTDPVRFVPRFASELGLSDEAERRARELIEAARDEELHVGRNPVGLAAAAIYAASLLSNERVIQSRISEVANVSEVTIRNRYTELLEAAADG